MKKFYRLMNEAGGLGDGGDGGAGAGGTGGGNGGSNTGGAASTFSGPEWAKDLKLEGIEADVLNDPSLKPIQSVSSLLKSYVHGQRHIGTKGVRVPTENSSAEEWDAFWQQAGVPLEADKWSEKFKPAADLGLDEGLGKEYVKLAHQLRVSPEKAQKLFELFGAQSKSIAERYINDGKTKAQTELDAFRDEIGADAYSVKVAKASKLLKEVAGDDFMKYIQESGMAKNAQFVRAMTKFADKYMGEAPIEGGESGTLGMTLDQAQQKINMHMQDLKGPYLNANHADHKRTVDEVSKLFAYIEKNKNRS